MSSILIAELLSDEEKGIPAATASNAAAGWTRSFRSRSKVNDMIVTHCDGSLHLEFFDTEDDDKWHPLVKLPKGAE